MPSPRFQEFCNVLDRLNKTKGTTQKKEIFSKYLNKWRSNYGLNFYDAMRMFLPKLDSREYGLKEDALAVRLVKALSLDVSSGHGEHLKNWRLPSKISPVSGDLANVAYEKIKDRSSVSVGTKTIKETHEILDELANSNSMEKHVSILKRMIKSYTPSEMQWIIRIIVKDLKIGLSENSVLTVFHKDAKAAYDSGKSLYYICRELMHSSAKFNDEHISIFYPLKPQRGVRNSNDEFKKFIEDNQKLFLRHSSKAPYFYVEEKIDGDRMQLHYDPGLDKFMWFTRNQNNFTLRFGSNSNDTGKLSSQIYKGLPSKRVILDGEMVAFDPKTNVILPFGTVRTSTQNDIEDSDEAHPCFIVFDILWFDDKLMMPYPLEERLYLLESIITNQGNSLKLLTRKKMTTEEEAMNELNEAMKMRMEGLMLKMPYASYQIKQTNAWLKVKPDYMDSLLDNCDLLVVGAKYGTGRRNHSLAQFFCAIRDDSIPDYEHPKFISFSMVGIGFKDEDIAKLNSMIKSRPKYDSKNQPKWLTHPKNSSEKPDIVIDYKEHESSLGGKGKFDDTIKFMGNAICPKVNYGHSLSGISLILYKDVQRVKMEGLTGITKRKSDESTQHTKEKKKKRPKSSALLESQRGLDSSQLVKKTTVFEALKIFIVSGIKDYSKQALEKLAIENGAECVQKAESANILIAGNKTFHVISLINSGKYNILSHQYFLDCIKEQDLLNIEPKYMVHITEAAKEYFMEFMDPWGDSYTAFVSEEKLGEVAS
ncbi:hypothetical protein G6F43_010802 [Rhizopus delemar]|nr:hypothetical protein G6F43_010802 [Rhizopus delemar]